MKNRNIAYVFPIQILLLLFLSDCSIKKNENKLSRSIPDNLNRAAPLSLLYYSCPQHPQIRQYNPGLCSICRSDLIKSGALVQESDTPESRHYPVYKSFHPVYIPLNEIALSIDSINDYRPYSLLVRLSGESAAIFRSNQVIRLVDQQNDKEILAYLEYQDKGRLQNRTARITFISSNNHVGQHIGDLKIKAYKEGLWVPVNCLITNHESVAVLLYRDRTHDISIIKTGIESGRFIEVTEGLHPGDTLLLLHE